MTRMKDVAEKAGVSISTVSHVVRGSRPVNPRTLHRVQKAIKELGYEPDVLARGLRRRETMTLGVLVTDITNLFFNEVVRGIEDIAHPHGYSVVQGSSDEDPQRQDDYLRILSARRVDGLLIVPTSRPSDMLHVLHRRGIPTVFVDRRPLGFTGPLVGIDNVAAAKQAVNHLIADGHTRIGIVTGLRNVDTHTGRLEGYLCALAEHSLDVDDSLIQSGDSRIDGGYTATHALLRLHRPPTALFITNNLMVLGALRALREESKRCPHDVALLGFDDNRWLEEINPPLTVVKQPPRDIGRKAAELLLAMLRREPIHTQEIILPTKLIIRGSCSVQCYQAFSEMQGALSSTP